MQTGDHRDYPISDCQQEIAIVLDSTVKTYSVNINTNLNLINIVTNKSSFISLEHEVGIHRVLPHEFVEPFVDCV